MMATTIPFNTFFTNIPQTNYHPANAHLEKTVLLNPTRRKSRPTHCNLSQLFNPRKCFYHSVLCRVGGDGDAVSQQSTVSDVDTPYNSLSSTSENYVPVLIRMLGLDNDPLDREQAVIALWKYSLGGKHYVDNIMQFRGCVNLIVTLLMSESSRACEAAAGLLRVISSYNVHRDIVAESGAIEEATALLRRPSMTTEVKEQSICMLWNLSVDEKLRGKIANSSLLPLLINCLDDEDMKVTEAAGGVLANLALSTSNHEILVEAGVIPKLAKFLTCEIEGAKVIRKEARNALLELSKDDYYKILVMEEGLVLVPLVGAAAYGSFRPALYSWPSLPDGTELRRSSKGSSRYGASELLLGLNLEDNTSELDKTKMDAIVARTQQQFLARIGAIEIGHEGKSDGACSASSHHTLLPWKDGVARLVLILELEDVVAIAKAADAIAAASINETMRISFKEAGAVKRLSSLLNHNSDAVLSAAVNALEKLSVSNRLCETLIMEGVMHMLVDMLKDTKITESLTEKIVSILQRILDPNKQMKFKFYNGPVNGSRSSTDSTAGNVTSVPTADKAEMKNMLDCALVIRLGDLLKIESPSLQAKVASILEFVMMVEPCTDSTVARHLESGLSTVFKQNLPKDLESDVDDHELDAAFVEEAGLAVSAASRLLTKLLDYQQFSDIIDLDQFTSLLRQILKSDIPLHYKDWVASCLVRLSLSTSPFENPVTTEVTLYETIPRLIEQINSSSADVQEAAVAELNRIISEGVVGASRAVADHGGIFPLVKVLDQGSERSVEASLAILHNLSMDSENHSAILAAGAVPVLRRIILSQTHPSMRALHLLRNLPV